MHRTTAVVEPPLLQEASTEGFRVADVKLRAHQFLDSLSSLLSAGPSIVAEPPPGLDASDLPLPPIEEALQAAMEGSPQPNGPYVAANDDTRSMLPINGVGYSTRRQAREQNGAAPSGATAAHSRSNAQREASRPDLTQNQRDRQQAIDAYNAAVAAVRERHERELAAAAQRLRALRVVPLKTTEREGRRHRDYVNLIPYTAMGNSVDPSSVAGASESQMDEGEVADASRNENRPEDTPAAAAATPVAEATPSISAAASPKVTPGEVVVRIAVHLPQAPAHVSEEWLVLGSQKLSALRDALFCLTEANIKAVEKEENARRALTNAPLISLSKPSSYFYIEGTFFIDDRSSNSGGHSTATAAVDLSEMIRAYLKQNKVAGPLHPPPGPASRPLSAFTTDYSVASMEDRVFDDIWVKLGCGAAGLFCHQGGCEHLMVIQDVRLHDPEVDPPLLSQFPFRFANPGGVLTHKRRCECCGVRFAKKVTHEDKVAPYTPFFWCEECFKLMHYDGEGKAVYTDFRVFPYLTDYQSALLHEKRREGAPGLQQGDVSRGAN